MSGEKLEFCLSALSVPVFSVGLFDNKQISVDCTLRIDESEIYVFSEPKASLVSTLIFYSGIHCSLRAAQEHRGPEFGHNSQPILRKDQKVEEYSEYVERIPKNKGFGINCTRMEPKITSICPSLQNT